MEIAEHFKYVFEPDLIAELEEKGKYLKLSAGEALMEVGQTVRIMPIILSGTIKVSRIDDEGKELLLYYVNANESCAMSFTCCMQHRPSEIKAEADDEVEIIALPVSVMDEWLVKYATWKNFVMKTIQDRFNELLKSIDQIAFQKLDERLVHYLKEKSKVTGSAVINLSHEQIANELATSRVVVSRLLKKLENDKKLILYRNQIKIFKDL
ncbi:MAG TPA: Crp/Fnr family transcriptional regulator [Cyclobacteriaceae bacterium]